MGQIIGFNENIIVPQELGSKTIEVSGGEAHLQKNGVVVEENRKEKRKNKKSL